MFGNYTFGMYAMVKDSILYAFYLLVEALFVYILINFELSNITLKSNVPGDGSVEIIGVNIRDNVLFKFKINEEKLQK